MPSILPLAIGLVALLYASVGHAGATGYIAVMTLLGLPVSSVRPTALVLNVIVATIATVQFVRAGHFRSGLFWPLTAASVPCAFLGGTIMLSTTALEAVLGIVLLAATVRMLLEARDSTGDTRARVDDPSAGRPSALWAMLGGAIGLMSGLTGVGGGVFLTPALATLHAAPVKSIAAVTAPFILANSLAGLAGGMFVGRPFPAAGLPVIAAALLGGFVGSSIGAFRLTASTLRLLMAAVLAFASIKLLGRPLGL